MTDPRYRILRTRSETFVDNNGELINGYVVTFKILYNGEVHQVRTRSLDSSVVEAAVDEVFDQRAGLESLGG